jgi:hypothetical protein
MQHKPNMYATVLLFDLISSRDFGLYVSGIDQVCTDITPLREEHSQAHEGGPTPSALWAKGRGHRCQNHEDRVRHLQTLL